MKVTVVGTGYVGLVTGACLAEVGNEVTCFDVDARKIAILKDGGIPIHEPGLTEMIRRNVEARRLAFTTELERAVCFADIQIIAVGTPPGEDGSADVRYVLEAARAIGDQMTGYKLVVNKSTVPVGTADNVGETLMRTLERRGVQLEFDVASNPEFLKEGAAIEDFMKPDRIVVGTDSDRAKQLLLELYAPFQRNHDRLVVMDIRSAELTKYAANAMLATRISFMNEMANLAESVGADIERVRRGIGADPRIGYDFLYAGCGYGGSCFPKDVQALLRTARNDAAMNLKVLSAVEQANAAQKLVLPHKVKRRFGQDLYGRRFALWGLAFKPNTDDMREAPSETIIREIVAARGEVCAYDPAAIGQAQRLLGDLPGVSYATDAVSALNNADALLIVTEWKEFRSPDFDTVAAALRSPIIFDGRNLYDPVLLRSRGFEYHAIGR